MTPNTQCATYQYADGTELHCDLRNWFSGPREEALTHFQNFIDCVRSRNVEHLTAPLEEGHLSTTICHLGNISCRLGRSVKFDGATERFVADDEADTLLGRTYRAPYSLPTIT